ncbi:3-isopropylmalate dehydrogenase [Nymphaea thermarum]|nr:3-isopropylmalate dehydrogenase [Nymphaea thermarum]
MAEEIAPKTDVTIDAGIAPKSENLLVQVTPIRLTKDNYLSWSAALEIGITSRGRLPYITGDKPAPSKTDPQWANWALEDSQVYNRKQKDVLDVVEVTNPNPPDDPSPMSDDLPIALRKGTRFTAYKTRYDNVDLVAIRENKEGEYSGPEHQVVRGVVESLKIITRQARLTFAEYAFHYGKTHGRKKVSPIHKANNRRKTDGLFLKMMISLLISLSFPFSLVAVLLRGSKKVVKNPSLFDVLVMPNLCGGIMSDLCAALIGGLGLMPSCNIGEGGIALAEAVHGSCWQGENSVHVHAYALASFISSHCFSR